MCPFRKQVKEFSFLINRLLSTQCGAVWSISCIYWPREDLSLCNCSQSAANIDFNLSATQAVPSCSHFNAKGGETVHWHSLSAGKKGEKTKQCCVAHEAQINGFQRLVELMLHLVCKSPNEFTLQKATKGAQHTSETMWFGQLKTEIILVKKSNRP